jgi:hypothetical protein
VRAAFATGAIASGFAAAGLTALIVWTSTVISGSGAIWSTAPWLVTAVAAVVAAATYVAERELHRRMGTRQRATGEPWAYRDGR